MRPSPRRDGRRRGITLMEVMVTSVIMGILISLSVPSFRKALEQSRVDIAAANLRAIWSAERIYWLENRRYTDLDGLRGLGLIDPSIGPAGAVPFEYALTVAADGSTFSATARRNGEPSWSGTLSIDETGAFSDTSVIRGGGGEAITPGFE